MIVDKVKNSMSFFMGKNLPTIALLVELLTIAYHKGIIFVPCDELNHLF
jgi:hypothetical protein